MIRTGLSGYPAARAERLASNKADPARTLLR
jgi:hypothetical protein